MKKIEYDDQLLFGVEKPARYVGGEWNSRQKKDADVRIALAYPDVYEIGMSNLGLQILYEIINDQPRFSAERVFAPWPDMEAEMRKSGIALSSLESGIPVTDFDIFGLTLQYELTFTNILNMLDLAGIPIFAKGRAHGHPLLIGGGPCAFNPEPLSAFFDLFFIGEAEEAIIEILEIFNNCKKEGKSRAEIIERLSVVKGIYAPHVNVLKKKNEKKVIEKRLVIDFNKVRAPVKPVVPYMETIHDRCMVEIMRGCTRGCRFCQAGILYRPFRERTKKVVKETAREIIKTSGYKEVSLVSLSSADHSQITSIVRELKDDWERDRISVSLPSLRTDRFSVELAAELSKIKKSGLTFAPEAGSERLRKVINKGITEDDILNTALAAFQAGWRRLKLYFMIGLPTETDEDVEGIVRTSMNVIDLGKNHLPKKEFNKIKIVTNVSTFVPKPHTPFQWLPMIGHDEIVRKHKYLIGNLTDKRVKLKWHHPEMSIIEGSLSRGSKELCDVIFNAWRAGCRFDGWDDHFSWRKWNQAFNNSGVKIEDLLSGFDPNAELPWEYIDTGVLKEWLIDEMDKALTGLPTPDCRENECSLCGVCPNTGASLEKADDQS